MSGSNSNMTLVANVAKDLDGSDPSLSPYTWTCPDVDPYSTIYFYQFTAVESDPAWTTRFTVCTPVRGAKPTSKSVAQIASPAGETTVPSYSKQPNGDNIPWGIGVLQSGSSVASREKHPGSSSTEEEDLDDSYSSDENGDTSQRPGNTKAKGEAEYDEETSSRTSTKKGSDGSSGTSSGDSEDSEGSEDDETSSSTNSRSSKSALKDSEKDSKGSDATDLKNGGTEGSSDSPTSSEDEESELGDAVSTSSRLKTVHSKPTLRPSPAGNINAATPTIPLPSAPPSSAQPVGCAGGINATSSYCSAPSSTNHATSISKLDLRMFFVAVLVISFGLLELN